jgi:hypothetical protein
MGIFDLESTRDFPWVVPDLAPVARDVMQYFEQQGYEVLGTLLGRDGWDVSISKQEMFNDVFGMRTALKVTMVPTGTGTRATAKIGFYGQTVLPESIAQLLLWPASPVLQLWNMVQQGRLDEAALRCIEKSLQIHARTSPRAAEATTPPGTGHFCTQCGTRLAAQTKFCSECGEKVA